MDHMNLEELRDLLWAIQPEKLQAIILAARTRVSLSPVDVQAAAARATVNNRGAVAVLPVYGTIMPRADAWSEFFGVAGLTRVSANFRAALADPAVGAIVLDIDSPGGVVQGVEEFAGEIAAARGVKPIVAVANHLAASAAYWIATAADELLVAPSGEVGSIGVFAAHEDWSRALDAMGVNITLVSAGKYKTEGNPWQPLSEEALAAMQSRINEYYDRFTKAVARNRGVGVSDVRDGFGQGRVVGSRQAVTERMADAVGTLEDAIVRAAKLARRPSGGSASADAAFDAELDGRMRRARSLELQQE